MNTRHNAGMMPGPVMLDVVGTELDAEDTRRIRHPLTGGVILFARNFTSRSQLVALTSAIHAIRPDVVIAVDHEGGRVQRFKTDGFTRLPAMRKLGELWETDVLQANKVATAVGYVLAAELRACGVDLSFTPVLDLDYGQSTVVGDRSFHRDPRIVTMLAKSLNHGLLLAGMANCGKHFPGHGYVEADSHVAMPVDERSLQQIMEDDVLPYDWLGMSLTAVMPAHVVYPKVDKHPAGFSKKWLTILRETVRFDGVIFSDDMSMEGARAGGGIVEGAHAALDAGCDMVLVCNSPALADELLQNLKVDVSAETAARIGRMKPAAPALSWDTLQADSYYQHARELVQSLV